MSFQMEKFQKSIYNSSNTFPLTEGRFVGYVGYSDKDNILLTLLTYYYFYY